MGKILNQYMYNQNIPTNWNNSITILLIRKGDMADLERYRLIILQNHIHKRYTQIIRNRLTVKLNSYQSRQQASFCLKYGTNDYVECLKVFNENNIEYSCPLALIFVIFKKMFDTVELMII